MNAPCALPPDGWECTRPTGHDGPCAARPDGTKLVGHCPGCGNPIAWHVDRGRSKDCITWDIPLHQAQEDALGGPA